MDYASYSCAFTTVEIFDYVFRLSTITGLKCKRGVFVLFIKVVKNVVCILAARTVCSAIVNDKIKYLRFQVE